MKKKLSKNHKIAVIIIVAALITGSITAGVYVYKKRQSSKNAAMNQAQTSTQTNSNDNQSSQEPNSNTNANTPAPAPSSATQAPTPKQPVLIKSSGNNGPVPSGVNISFTCTAELGVDCSIILDANGKQTVLGPTKVTDNGRGQYFALFYWTSVMGSYRVSAQAKNSQGGISSSIVQALEVQ